MNKKNTGSAKVMALCNQKGGVSKSASTVHLGAALARMGYKVLLIDADPQGSTTKNLGFYDEKQFEATVKTVMELIINEEDFDPSLGILHHEEGFDLLPSSIELAAMELTLVNIFNRERVLRDYISMVRLGYDFILIDSGPSLGMLPINVLAASDSVIIPVEADKTSVDGLQLLIKTVFKIRRQINYDLEIEGILISKVNKRTNYSKDVIEAITNSYGDNIHIFENYIPMSVRVAECPTFGCSIFKHAPNEEAARAYMELAKEVSV